MTPAQGVRPGEKVLRSGIYQERRSKRRATLVKGEPAPPTPYREGEWDQVVDTESGPTPFDNVWSALSGVSLGAFLTTWILSPRPRRDPRARQLYDADGSRCSDSWRRSGYVMAFTCGVVLGLLVATAPE